MWVLWIIYLLYTSKTNKTKHTTTWHGKKIKYSRYKNKYYS